MGSSGKGGGAKQDNYYGTLAGAVCIGPVDALVAIILGGKFWYRPASPLARGAEAFVDLPDTRAGGRNGKLRFYWGTEAQTADPTLVALQGADNVPPYRGVCYFVLSEFLFGTAAGTAPNLEFIVRRKPAQDLVVGDAAALDSEAQANPVATAAEVARAWYGLDLAASALDAASFQALAAEINGSAEKRARVNCSPLWTSTAAARSLFLDLGATGDLWFRLGSTNLIEAGRWSEAGPTGPITTLDANALAAELETNAEGVDELPTSVSVDFADRAYTYADSAEKVDELALLRQQGRPTVKKLRRMQVTRREQARAQAAEELRRTGRVVLGGSVKVRRARAVNPSGTPIRPGDWFNLDVDPEPGGAGVAILCRCTGRLAGPTGPVTLEWEADPGAVPEPFQPEYEVSAPVAEVIAPVDVARVLAIPGDGDLSPAISVLALRGDETWEQVEVFYSDSSGGDYVSLGAQVGFACPAQLTTAVDENTEVIRVQLVPTFAGLNGAVDGTLDADLLREAIGAGTDVAARNDELLLVLVRKDPATGAVVANGNLDWVEVCSVVDLTPVSAGVYDVRVLRGRQGTRVVAFDSVGGAVSFPAPWSRYEVWCIPASRLARLDHADFESLPGGAAAHFRLSAQSAVAVYSPEDAEQAGLQPDTAWRPQIAYPFAIGLRRAPVVNLVAPVNGAQVPTSGLMAVDVAVADEGGDLVEVSISSSVEDTGANYTEHLRRLIPATGSYVFTGNLTIPAVEGNHRVLFQARDLGGRVVQREVSVFRFTSATPVPPPSAFLLPPAPGFYYYTAGFSAPTPNGYSFRYHVTKPTGIDYVAVPHTILVRSRLSNGTWSSWTAWAPNWFLAPPPGEPEWNYLVPKGARRQLMLRRDGDLALSSVITLQA